MFTSQNMGLLRVKYGFSMGSDDNPIFSELGTGQMSTIRGRNSKKHGVRGYDAKAWSLTRNGGSRSATRPEFGDASTCVNN